MGLWGRGQSCMAQAHPICAQVAKSLGGRRSASATSHQASHKAQHTKCAPSSAPRCVGSSWEVLLGFDGKRCAWVKEELVVLFHNDQATGEGAGGAEC
jgi:hypothetical protein